jgi:hypothetical protein
MAFCPLANYTENVRVRVHKTIILPLVLYGCETWSLTLMQELSLRVFQNIEGEWSDGRVEKAA